MPNSTAAHGWLFLMDRCCHESVYLHRDHSGTRRGHQQASRVWYHHCQPPTRLHCVAESEINKMAPADPKSIMQTTASGGLLPATPYSHSRYHQSSRQKQSWYVWWYDVCLKPWHRTVFMEWYRNNSAVILYHAWSILLSGNGDTISHWLIWI